jgi:hypothetical protein
MIRRLLSSFLLLLALHFCCVAGPAAAQSNASAASDGSLLEPAAAPAEEPRTVFQSGVKYDPISHQWLDRYNGKPMNLGLPGVEGRYGAQNVLASNDVIAANSGPGSGTTTTTANFWNYKKFLIFSLLGLGIATSIVVPICVGAAYHDHQFHHQQNTWQANQLAAYYFFHNHTFSPPPIFVIFHEHHGHPKPPPE